MVGKGKIIFGRVALKSAHRESVLAAYENMVYRALKGQIVIIIVKSIAEAIVQTYAVVLVVGSDIVCVLKAAAKG